MRQLASIASAFLLAALVAVPASAQDLTGTWQIATEGPRGSQQMTLQLVQDGTELVGEVTITGGRGGRGGPGGGGPRTLEISDGVVDGSGFAFSYSMNARGNPISIRFEGTVDGDSMEGTIQGPRGGGRPFQGARGG